jgi:plasmid maintenance system killer protein
VTHPDSLRKYLDRAVSIWINDGYWLVMPFKLMDPGVSLAYLGESTDAAGVPVDILRLTFEGVGDTPQNMYRVYIDKSSRLITQWDYYTHATDSEPRLSNRWGDYRSYGKILLSGDRGDNRQLSEIAVFEEYPDSAFEVFR